jgi:hypothetical protein
VGGNGGEGGHSHVGVAHPALEDILEAGHTVEGLASDVKHRRRWMLLATAARSKARAIGVKRTLGERDEERSFVVSELFLGRCGGGGRSGVSWH